MAFDFKEGRDYPEDFGLKPRICNEFVKVDPGGPWYIDVSNSDLPSVFHAIRHGLSFANNEPEADHPLTQRRAATADDLKVRWTLTRAVSRQEYIISFTYLWPVEITVDHIGLLCGYSPSAINTARTRVSSDDVTPRKLYVHVRWLPYPALEPLDVARAQCFVFYPSPVIHLHAPPSGVDMDYMASRPPRKRNGPGIMQKVGNWFRGADDDVDAIEVDDDEGGDEKGTTITVANKEKRGGNGEPQSKKRKIEVV
jgi:hypothetical protein